MESRAGPARMTFPVMGQQGPWRTFASLPKNGTIILRLHDGSEELAEASALDTRSLEQRYTSWRPE
jgi:hypothetical protein